MAKQGKSPLPEERMPDEGKLRKRQQHLQERLQKAYSAQDRAAERLRRAEARLQKRQTRVQRLQERLTAAEQQLRLLDSIHIVPPVSELFLLSRNEPEQSLPNSGSVLAEKPPLAPSSAEAAEKQAIQDAQDTEAEAEVAEGMALSADQRLEDSERAPSGETKTDDP